MDRPCSPTWQAFTHTQPHKPGNKNWTTAKSPSTASPPTGSESLTSGQTLVWNRPPWIEPDTPQHFEVLFEDAHLLAVNKPGGLPTLPGGGFMENTLLRLVQKQTPNANPVHRLGRATTGIVLFAKTAQAASKLGADWNTPRIQKIYLGAGSKHCTARRLRNPHTHRPCTAPAHRFGVGR